jgi:hypothetical protein
LWQETENGFLVGGEEDEEDEEPEIEEHGQERNQALMIVDSPKDDNDR